jgi:predicted glycoside hydrolase/deacetylase ChbG (UPF0249 family)
LDLGVHLNLTHGSPLTLGKKNGLGCFPKKHTLFKAVLSGALKPKEVKLEWRAQIERCLDKGLNLKFLYSHQHIHMLPSLFSVTLELAETYRIPHIRISVPERLHHSTSGILARDSIMILLGLLNHHKLKSQEPLFLGMAESGKLGSASMALQFRKLKSGHIYELMCHPGLCNPDEIKDPRLLRYHDWNKEFNAVAVPGLKARFLQQGIRFIGYRDIEFLKDRVPALTVNNLN